MKKILVTGGAGFVGSHLALRFKAARPGCKVVALDNLRRRGSELALSRLRSGGVEFLHGDVRTRADVLAVRDVDLVVDCAAEPSALAGLDGAPDYVIETNLVGTLHCLELARRDEAALVLLSTSRVYPWATINRLAYRETEDRFVLEDGQSVVGASGLGLAEDFPLEGPRSLYGASKLASELFVREYVETYGVRALVNRCGVLAGPWQMGKVDQGFVALWAARHVYGGGLAYIGHGGRGKQVRDILHVDDLFDLLERQIARLDDLAGEVFNVGGGPEISVSLRELTRLCREATGRRLEIRSEARTRPGDPISYLSDCRKVARRTGWTPTTPRSRIVGDVVRWIVDHRDVLEPILN